MFPAAKSIFPSAENTDLVTDAPGSSEKSAAAWLSNPSFHVDEAYHDRGRPDEDHYPKSESSSLRHTSQPSPRKHHKKERRHGKEVLSGKHKNLSKHEDLCALPSQPVKPRTIWIEESGLDIKDAYRLDAKSDTSNLSYDTLYSGDLANYKRLFGDQSLGLNWDQEIKFTDSRSRKKKEKKSKVLRYHQVSALEPPQSTQLNFGREQSCNKPLRQTFLHLETDDSDAKNDQQTPEVYISRLNSDYNQKLLADPHDVSLWLEFIAFQDEALIWGRVPGVVGELGDDSQHVRKKRLALLERKVAIFERALESNPMSEQLLVGHMELVQEFWETERLVKRWKDIVFRQPHKSLLWLRYITFCQSRFSFFRFSSLDSLYSKCMSTLAAILNRTILSHKPEPHGEKNLVAVFLLYCYFLRQSGHSEKAIANLQALIEFNLCCPEELLPDDHFSFKQSIDCFEAFWDSGAALVGEEGAEGWDTWWKQKSQKVRNQEGRPMDAISPDNYCLLVELQASIGKFSGESRTDEGESESSDDMDIQVVKNTSLHEGWVKLESLREKAQCLPCRTIKQEDVEDPERIVIFDDISKHLFFVGDVWLKEQLVLEFLRFLGAPVAVSSFLPSVFPSLAQFLSTPSEILHAPQVLMSERRVNNSSSFQYHMLLDPGCEMDCLSRMSPLDLLCTRRSVENLDMSLVESFQAVPPTCSFGSSGPTRSFVTTLFNHALFLFTKHSSSSVSLVVKSWLLYELKYLVRLECSLPVVKPALVQLQSLSVSLFAHCPHKDYRFFLDFAVAIEQLLGLKKKPSQLSKVLLEPFSSGKSLAMQDLLPIAQCIVEYMLGLRRPPNCYSHYKPSPSLATFVLVSLAEDTFNPTLLPVTNVQLSSLRTLKARKVLQHHVSDSIQQLSASSTYGDAELGRVSSAVACQAYLDYLHSGLSAACEVLEASCITVGRCGQFNCSSLVENLHYIRVRLVLCHAKSNPIRPATLRLVLEQALERFPSHLWFLQAFLECERQSYVSGRVRRFFDSQTSKNGSVVMWLFAVRAEMERHKQLTQLQTVGEFLDEPETGCLHRARSLLTKATSSNSGRGCPALWRLFMKFEVWQGRRKQAKAIFYQAIEQCPWAKVLYSDAALYFPEELTKIHEMLEEKELRVRAPLEEVDLLM